MKVKLEWLNELVDLTGLDTNTIVNRLSLFSTEIEGVEKVISGSNLAVGHVLTCVNHPDSDHLHITTVDVGDEIIQVVCGAPNIAKGQYVIVAKVGAELPGGFKIKKSKIRGVESFGMICSLEELGMEHKFIPTEYSEGIYYFNKEVKPGDNPLKLLNFDDDVLELGLTPNRQDLLSMLGVAYEVSAVFDREMKLLEYNYKCASYTSDLNVKIETDKCTLYYAKEIRDIKIDKSPEWLTSRLIAFGIRPINNAVDITNYILALYGQPLHAFDKSKLGNKIVIRNAYSGEEFITLDNVKRVLTEDDIVVTDGKNPVALAGVMGGLNTSVDENSKDIVLEAAVFDPKSVRKTYKRLDLRSESAVRFEKGLDKARTREALEYACYLYNTLCKGEIASNVSFAGDNSSSIKEIKITPEYVSNYLGIEITKERIIKICNLLKFEVSSDLTITIPSRRSDISIKADMVEEIGRIHGYAYLPETLPSTSTHGGLTNYQMRRRTLKHTLANLGVTESINYSLRDNNNDFTYLFNDAQNVELLYPISNERKMLRRNLIPSLLENVSYVLNRKIKNAAFFEVGKVYYYKDGAYIEEEHLAIAMTGSISSTKWQGKNEVIDFYTIKGILNQALKSLGVCVEYERVEENSCPQMHPLRTAKLIINNEKEGYIGMLHPKYAQENSLDNVYVCELNISKILNEEKANSIYTPVSKVPAIERDLAIVLKKEVSSGELVRTIKSVDSKLIKEVNIFDVYVGDKILDDEKSIALRIVFVSNDSNTSLTDDIINGKINKILKQIEKNFGGYLRK